MHILNNLKKKYNYIIFVVEDCTGLWKVLIMIVSLYANLIDEQGRLKG